MKLFLLTFFNLFIVITSIYSQQKFIEGEIQNSKNFESLAYVNIGIVNKNIGTVSNIKGKFRLKLNQEISKNDTITFSHVGFLSKHILVSALSNNNTILLKPKVNDLNEVIVKAKTPKPKKIGRHSKGLGLMHANFYSYYDEDVDDNLSRERGMKLNIKKNCSIKDLNFNITSNDFSSLKFRVNFYKIENDLPTKLIIDKNIIFEIKDSFLGWFTVDLEPYDVYFNEETGNIAVSIQWVESIKSNEKSKYFSISTAASPIDTACFRDKAMSKWTKNDQSFSFYLNAMCN